MTQHEPHPQPTPSAPHRRTFLEWAWQGLTVGMGALAAAFLAIPLVGYLIGPLRREEAPWLSLGPIDRFPQGETRRVTFDNPIRLAWDGEIAHTAAYVRYEGTDDKSEPKFLVLSVNCAHLGCPVSWFAQSGLFMCPCHGGVYYADGSHASGPPPRGMFPYDWRVREGRLEVRAPHYPTLQDTLSPEKKERS